MHTTPYWILTSIPISHYGLQLSIICIWDPIVFDCGFVAKPFWLTVNSIAIVMPTPYVAIYINSQEVKWFVQISIHDVVWGLFDTDRHEQFYTTATLHS